jgi:hypothetical protein
MKIEAYEASPIQPGDLVFGYRPGATQPALRLSGVNSTDGSLDEITVSVVLDRTSVLAMNVTGQTLITPPEGKGVQLTAPVGLVVDDDGTPFLFSSGETLDIGNTSLGSATMASFGDPAVTSEPISSAALIFSYDVVVDSPVNITATFPVTGGGTNATMTFILKYRLLP